MTRRLAGRGAIITPHVSTNLVTLSIVNYMVYNSNGATFERADIPLVEGETGRLAFTCPRLHVSGNRARVRGI